MESIIRVMVIYAFLMLVFRLSGKRTLAESTPFDLLMLLIISETTQQALIGEDPSITNALLMILTFVGMDVGLSLIKQRSEVVSRLLDDVPLVVAEHGRLLADRASKSRIDESDVLEAARQLRGLERMDQIKYAILERNGQLSIIPESSPPGTP